MLVVKYKYSEKQVKKIEPFMQALPNLAGIGTALYGLFRGIYGSAMLWCWIESDDTQYRCVTTSWQEREIRVPHILLQLLISEFHHKY